MKILLAQINTIVGNIKENVEKMIAVIAQAKNDGINIVVFPELSITGYPPKDLLEYGWFVDNNKIALKKIAEHTNGIGVICGYVESNPKKEGKNIYNSAAFLYNGEIILQHNKCLLPTYDVFDEGRYFEADRRVQAIDFMGVKIGVAICEDIWNDKIYWSRRKYQYDPIEEMAKLGIVLLIVINASPFTIGKRELKNEMISNTAKRFSLPIVNVYLVGGNDGLIFDGASNCFDRKGNVAAQARDFCEEYLTVEYKDGTFYGEMRPQITLTEELLVEAITLGLKDYVQKTGFKKAAVGLSGGIDSAVTAVLAVKALGKENVLGVSMPSQFSSQGSKDDAKALAENLGIRFTQISIESIFNNFCDSLKDEFKGTPHDITEENIQARIRGVLLMAISNKFNYLILATGNKSELAVGYCTLYGDMCGGIAPIADVPKTLVYKMASFINREKVIIPHNTMIKPPSAELRPEQKDTDTLPPYEILDPILTAYIEEHKSPEEIIAMGFEENVVRWVLRKINLNEYKRQQAAVALKVTTKAFGYGRRFPIAVGGDFINKLIIPNANVY